MIPYHATPQVVGRLERNFIKRLPSVEELLSLSVDQFKVEKFSSGKYLHRTSKFESSKNCPKVLHQILKFYGFTWVSLFCSMEEQSLVGLDFHVDDYDVLAFNLRGTTEWIFDYNDNGVPNKKIGKTGIKIEPYDLIYMPEGWRHTVDVKEERFSISLVRKNPKIIN